MTQFETKVKYTKEQSDNTFKRVTETYLLANCESFTEAETLMDKVVFANVKGETTVESITKRKYQYVLHDEKAEDWYKCTTTLTTTDPDTDKETAVKNTYLVQASSVDHAHERLEEFMGDSVQDMDDLDISGVTRVKITQVLEHKVTEFEVEEEPEVDVEKEVETE